MTAFLNTDRLRREALPGGLAEHLRRVAARRPSLCASWQLGPDGRLTCRWDTDDPVAKRLPR